VVEFEEEIYGLELVEMNSMYCKTRDEEVTFIKRLWSETPTVCPKCGKSELVLVYAIVVGLRKMN